MPCSFRISRKASPNARSGPATGWMCRLFLVLRCLFANRTMLRRERIIVPRTIVGIRFRRNRSLSTDSVIAMVSKSWPRYSCLWSVALLLGLCSDAGGQAQPSLGRQNLGAVRILAGESRWQEWEAGGPRISSIVEAHTIPALDFPIRVDLDARSRTASLRITAPPATPPGDYMLEVTGRSDDGGLTFASLSVRVDEITLPRSVAASVPAMLINGFQLVCSNVGSTVADSQLTFGQMASLLQADGIPVAFFNNCAYGDRSIEQLAAQLSLYIAGLHYTDGTPVTQVDLVAHSMGGLIARAYLAGLQVGGSLAPPPNPRVRKLILIASPNFGSFQAPRIGTQTAEMVPGSTFLWDLATWNQHWDDLRGVDALAVVGNAGTYYQPGGLDDGVVSLTSGSLRFARSDQQTRIVPYCHTTPGDLSSFGMTCSGHRGIADIDGPSHLTAQIVRSFLADTPDWTLIGSPPSRDPYLSQYGGISFASENAAGTQYANDLTNVLWGTVALQNGGESGAIYYNEFVKGTATFQATSASLGAISCGPYTEPAGFYFSYRCKFAPIIRPIGVGPFLPGASWVVQSGAAITISGSGFGQNCAACAVFAYPGGIRLQVTSWTDQTITALLPSTFSGFVRLVVQNASGADSINIMAALAASAIISSVTNSASGAPGSIAPGEIITIKGSGLGPAVGVSFAVNPATGMVDSTLAGTRVLFGGFAAPVTYTSGGQVNAIVPYEVAGLSQVVMQAQYQGVMSAGTTLQVASAAPGVFTFNSTGTGQAVGANQDGTFNGPASPAAKGSYVTIYFTGGGQTNPPGVTGSVVGSTLKWLAQDISVTAGGVPATVAFDGAAPGLVDGVGQLNIQLANNTPSGTQPLVITVGGIASPATATLAVQ
jgi:uncharacterized protein (TIGR03437 family)